MERNIEFAFAVGERVNINANGLNGTVIGQWNGRRGQQFSVEYADRNGLVTDRWFFPEDIAAA